jgi:glycosyltransferase involved in cell wall biosynthesis
MGSKVKFLGYVADIQPLLEQADIFLIASRWEGFGLAAVEAMNASLPVVASEVDGLCDVVA